MTSETYRRNRRNCIRLVECLWALKNLVLSCVVHFIEAFIMTNIFALTKYSCAVLEKREMFCNESLKMCDACYKCEYKVLSVCSSYSTLTSDVSPMTFLLCWVPCPRWCSSHCVPSRPLSDEWCIPDDLPLALGALCSSYSTLMSDVSPITCLLCWVPCPQWCGSHCVPSRLLSDEWCVPDDLPLVLGALPPVMWLSLRPVSSVEWWVMCPWWLASCVGCPAPSDVALTASRLVCWVMSDVSPMTCLLCWVPCPRWCGSHCVPSRLLSDEWCVPDDLPLVLGALPPVMWLSLRPVSSVEWWVMCPWLLASCVGCPAPQWCGSHCVPSRLLSDEWCVPDDLPLVLGALPPSDVALTASRLVCCLQLCEIYERVSGARMHAAYVRPGGVDRVSYSPIGGATIRSRERCRTNGAKGYFDFL